MDAEAVSAALTVGALAPPIAKRLGLPAAQVEAALTLLAEGSQPAFVARYRPELVGGLKLVDLERIQAAAARAVAFEFRRQQVLTELDTRGLGVDYLKDEARRARDPLEFDDLLALARRKKRGPASKAKAAGLVPAALALWKYGSSGIFADAERLPKRLVTAPKPAAAKKAAPQAPAKTETPGESMADRGSPTDAAVSPETVEGLAAVTPESPVTTGDSPMLRVVEATVDEAAVAEAETVTTTPPPALQQHERATTPAEAAPEEDTVRISAPEEDTVRTSAPEAPPEEDTVRTSAPEAPPDPPAPSVDADAVLAAIAADAVTTDAEALRQVRTICAEHIGEHPPLRRRLRLLLLQRAKLRTKVVEAKKEKGARYAKFFDRAEACSSLAPTTVLAIHRAEREGVLTVDFDVDDAQVHAEIVAELSIDEGTPAGAELANAAREAWQFALGRAVRSGARKQIKQRADGLAVRDFAEALRPLMLSPAFGRKPILAVDPGTQHGCRLVVLDAAGAVVSSETVFPLQPKLQAPQAKARIVELCKEFSVALIAVTNGTLGREVERLCRDAKKDVEGLESLIVTSIDGDAAGMHASSKAGKDEMPKADAALRRAASAGRRLQDPLGELSKLDPRKLGLGSHQHEVEQELLRGALDQVVGSCIAEVGVLANAVSAERLARLPGMSLALAKAFVTTRGQKIAFRSRADLLSVPGFAGKAFEQAVGFISVPDGEQPLDATCVHPERYSQVTEMARDVGITVGDLVGSAEHVAKIDDKKYLGTPGVSGALLGEPSLRALKTFLRQPGLDPRPPFVTAAVHPDLQTFEDLKVGMELEGIVTHLANFGAFVDVGIAQEALAHVSELSHDFIKNPLEAVHVGQKVRGRVIEVSADKKKFSLSLKALLPPPDRPARSRPEGGRGRPADGGKGRKKGKTGGGRSGGPGGRGKGEGKSGPKREERTLEFRMDLSNLASLLDEK